jgi:hypothetical protein
VSSPPRIKLPLKTEKNKYETFRETVDALFEAKSLYEQIITDDTSFIKQYRDITQIITMTASKIFGHTKPYIQPKQNITNTKIKSIVANLRAIGGAIHYERSNRNAHVSPKAIKHHENALATYLELREETNVLQILSKDRKALHKTLYAERAKEIILRVKEADK